MGNGDPAPHEPDLNLMNNKKRVLKARAKTLAREPEKNETAQSYLEFLEFCLAHEKYAVEALSIREVFPLKQLTPIPCTPPFVLGIINLRGQIFSVIDIKKIFGLPDTEITDSSKVIIVIAEDMEVGILADDIIGVRKFPISEIREDLASLKTRGDQYVTGVTLDRVGILNISKLLGDDRIVVDEEVEV